MTTIDTLYGALPINIFKSLSGIKLAAFDVDGVFSDGRIYMGNDGEELKAFNTLDGYGVKAIMKLGIEVAIITGRRSHIVENRMQSLGVKHIIQGEEGKQNALAVLQQSLNIPSESTLAVGDDMPDIGMFNQSVLGIAVCNAHPYVKQQADYITTCKGGFGAVREVCDLLLQAHDQIDMNHGSSV
ncbi:3-deoxy-manno-octulosonate-8-phosphatase KdsC [Aestuariibacter sp. AA17]|uniref:3-deoxy-D-manno-octulosonate 8-phosphate phosphatase KdsC n=1 Tax=Fluctibacter corallii TaxID=2984329 RepID=A0ABT3A4Q0_9ALTE|nr:3-deoxy-manno-octulosonate-8-phosphatase KdsC [Aestuariibacter sp. AA17]MCV2883656.1 3-deoxy-manno-octulosonate-8-phosphatase KdsC [Aestuariibacter sp. AA17]